MDGAVCRSRSCHLCCMDTVMDLTERDISKLEGAGHRDFSTSEHRLVNVNGHCTFLGVDGLCTVYPIRPEGCRLYPLIMRLPERQAAMDRDCPHRTMFRATAEELIALEDLVGRLEAGH